MTGPLILDAVRTPRARVRRDGGSFAHLSAAQLLAEPLRALVARGLDDAQVEDLIIGVSTPVGDQGGNVARVAATLAGWSDAVPAGVVSRLCCSGLDAVASGAAQVAAGAAGAAGVVVAGGVESMSRVPMLTDRPAFALEGAVADAVGFVPIGVSADATAVAAGISRAELDAYGLRSQQRAAAAAPGSSVIPVPNVAGEPVHGDEGARAGTTAESLAELAPLFPDDPSWARVEERLGIETDESRARHTIGTAPQLADAAAALVLASGDWAAEHGRSARGRVLSWAHAAVRSPGLEATIPASRKALAQAGVEAADLDLVLANESFAVTPLLLARDLGVAADIVNPTGGAIAVGHPLGASGPILIADALDILAAQGGGLALVAIPAALGLGSAVVIEVFAG